MYKKLTYDQLLTLKSGFFLTLHYILKRNKYLTLKDYIANVEKQWSVIYHIQKQDYIWRTVITDTDEVIFFDEREKIELHATKDIIAKISNVIKDEKKIAAQSKSSESIEQILQKAFVEGKVSTIAHKDYLVYDIETSYATNDLRTMEFYIWYAYVVQNGVWTYRYIDRKNLYKFIQFMIEFDGYIIGFNSLDFDNPVSIYNGLHLQGIFSEELYNKQLTLINEKSLDLFQFVRHLTGKRMWLNKLSKALVGVWKTLESGKEWENLWKEYEQGDEKSLTILKDYCKNDVKMTYLTLWYVLYYKKLSLDNEDFLFDEHEFLELSNKKWIKEEDAKSLSEQIFSL